MKTALFIILPYPSHYNLSFSFARAFEDRGFEIVYTGLPYLEDHVKRQGFRFYALQYTTEYKIRTIKGFIGFFLRSLLDKKDVVKRYREWYCSVIEIKKAYEHIKPEMIFIDSNLSFHYLSLVKYSKPITILGTTFTTKKLVGTPPLTSLHVPKNTIISKLFCQLLWAKHLALRRLQELKKKIAYLNRDEIFFWKRFCRKQDLLWSHVFEYQNLFYRSLKDVPTIILAPKSLEFRAKSRSNEIYLDLPISRNEKDLFSEQYLQIKRKIAATKAVFKTRVAYCAFGTLSTNDSKRVFSFMNRIITAIQHQKDWTFIVSVGQMNFKFKTYDNIHFFKHVPQLDILSFSDVMITHGGLNSIKECLQEGVPMLVYPLNMKVDQPGNAARISNAKLGLAGRMEKDTPEEILRKLNIVFGMKKNMIRRAETIIPDQYFLKFM